MATLAVKINNSQKIKIIAIMLSIFAYPVEYTFAANVATAPKTTKTQPSTEVFDVKEKDLPAANTTSASGKDIPPPDFKEFEDDNYINKLLGDDASKQPPVKETTNKDTILPAQAPVVTEKSATTKNSVEKKQDPEVIGNKPTDNVIQDVIVEAPKKEQDTVKTQAGENKPFTAVDDKSKTDDINPPSKVVESPIEQFIQSPKSDNKTVTSVDEKSKSDATTPPAPATEAIKTGQGSQAPAVDNKPGNTVDEKSKAEATNQPATAAEPTKPEQVPTSATTQNAENPSAAGDKKVTEVALTSQELSDKEKADYAELRKHLLIFISSAPANNNIANKESPAEIKPVTEPEIVIADSTTPSAVNSQPQTNPLPADAPKPIVNASTSEPSPSPDTSQNTNQEKKEPQKVKSPDDFDDFLEPTKESKDAADQKVKPQQPEEKKADLPTPATPEIKTQANAPDNISITTQPSGTTTPESMKSTLPNTVTAQVEAPKAATEKAPSNNSPAEPAGATKIDTISPAPKEKTKYLMVDETESEKPLTREKPSEADKAYFKLLDKKRDALPESKKLSDASKDVIDGITPELEPLKKNAKKEPKYIKVEHGKTGEPALEEDGVKKSQNNIDVSVRKVKKDEDVEKTKVKLEKAYKALLVGQISAAISMYKDVIQKEPSNKDALFGLATAYHKNSQFDQARAIYTSLLKKEPGNKDALNNFLVLVAEEAPEDALIELEKLERINSDFSPIPAQIAMINLKLGDTEKAARYLHRAILLSPDNISYKYNLAITYDKMGKIDETVQLYRQIIEAVHGGAVIPGSVDKLLERLTYLEAKLNDKK